MIRYYVNPSTWWIGGVLAATLNGIPVICTNDETARFTPPPGMTCEGYTTEYATMSPGYLLPSTGDGICRWCQYSSGNDYLSTLNISAGDKWPDFGYFCVFVMSNYALVYFFIYACRIKGWGFGFPFIFGGLGKLVGMIKKPFAKKDASNDEEGTKVKETEKGTEGAAKKDQKPDASEQKAQKANDATGEEGAHTLGGV